MPPGHLPVRSYLAAPVVSRSGDVLGGLFFGHSRPRVFTEREERILVGIAAQAAVAKSTMGECLVVRPGQPVLLRHSFSLPPAGRAWALPVRVAPAVFARACSQERLAPEPAQWVQVLAAWATAALQASSPAWETTLARAV